MTTEQLITKIQELLPDHGQLQDYAANRLRNSSQRHVPVYHFTSPGGYLNDPSGYSYYKGVYHLFYQFVPEKDSCLGWGHAVSVDRIHWIDLPMALRPIDELACGSGGVLLEEDRAIAAYPGDFPDRKGAFVGLAESVDDLLIHWRRLSQSHPVMTYNDDGSRNPYVAFDPYLWKTDDTYYLLVAAGGSLPHETLDTDKRDFRNFNLFTSKDLSNWVYHHPILENDRYSALGDDGACPYFLSVNHGKHVLFHYSHMSGGQYIVGTYDQQQMKFYAENGGAFNSVGFYSGTHAPAAYADFDGTMHTIFNINYGRSDLYNNQILSMPRQYRLQEDNSLTVEPDGDYASLRYDPVHIDSMRIPANQETILESISADTLELNISVNTIEKTPSPAVFMPSNLLPMVEIRVLRSPDAEEYTAIRFYRNRAKNDWEKYLTRRPRWIDSANSVVEVDTSHSTLSPDVAIHPTESQEYYLDPNDPIDLRIFVDKSVVEVFAGQRKCISVRAYPTREDSTGVSILSRGVPVTLHCDAYKMKSYTPFGEGNSE